MTTLMRRDVFDFPVFERFFRNAFEPLFSTDLTALMEEGTLPVDVSEDDEHVYVRASLPGFRRENIDVEVHEGVLTIKAEHTEEHEDRKERYYRRERRFGSVSRRIALPSAVRADGTEAELRDGVLTVRIPKAPEARPRRVTIR